MADYELLVISLPVCCHMKEASPLQKSTACFLQNISFLFEAMHMLVLAIANTVLACIISTPVHYVVMHAAAMLVGSKLRRAKRTPKDI